MIDEGEGIFIINSKEEDDSNFMISELCLNVAKKPIQIDYIIGEDKILKKEITEISTDKKRTMKRTICLPNLLVPKILKKYHNKGHWDAKSTPLKVRENFTWPGLVKDTKLFCESCHTCQCVNKGKKNVGRMSYLPVWQRNKLIGLNTYSGIPKSGLRTINNHTLVITDFLTRFTWLVPVSDTKAKTVAQALIKTWFGVFSPPKKIISDCRREHKEFNNKLLDALYKMCQTKKLSTVGYININININIDLLISYKVHRSLSKGTHLTAFALIVYGRQQHPPLRRQSNPQQFLTMVR